MAGTLDFVLPEELLQALARRVTHCHGDSIDFRDIRERLRPICYVVGSEFLFQPSANGCIFLAESRVKRTLSNRAAACE